MQKSWRGAMLGIFGAGTIAAVLMASGMFTPSQPAAVPAGAVGLLPPAVAPPQTSGDKPAAAAPADKGGADTKAAQTPEQRIDALGKELLENPKNTAGWAELGQLQIQAKKFPLAADAYSTALEMDPKNAEYRTNYATSVFFMGMSRTALREYAKVVEEDPKSALGHMNLAVALSHSSPPDFPAAVAEWEQVVQLAPGEPIAAKAQEYLTAYKKP